MGQRNRDAEHGAVVERLCGYETPRIGWVKASEYDISKGGVLFYRFDGPNLKSIGIGHFVGDMFYGVHLDVFPKWDWKNLYILDESPTAGREEEHVLVFTPCLEDDPDHCGAYTSNCGQSLCYVKEIQVPVSVIKGKLTQSRADFIREVNGRDMGGVEAVRFAEWVREQNYKPYAGSWYLNGNNYAHQPHSTAQLYELFKQQNEK